MQKSEPSAWGTLAAWAGNLFGGMAAGLALSWYLAPGSGWAQAVGLLAFPLIFALGMKLWTAALAGAALGRLFTAGWKAFRRRADFETEALAQFAELRGGPLPGTNGFLGVALLVGLIAGVLTLAAPTRLDAPAVLGLWLACGLGYGIFLRWLARSGRLPPPDSA